MYKVHAGKNSRWNRELHRRLGTLAIWYMVISTCKFDVTFLHQGDGSTQAVTPTPKPTPALTRLAQRVRDRLRWTERLCHKINKGRTMLTPEEHALLVEMYDGILHGATNEATNKYGMGTSNINTAPLNTPPFMVAGSSEQS